MMMLAARKLSPRSLKDCRSLCPLIEPHINPKPSSPSSSSLIPSSSICEHRPKPYQNPVAFFLFPTSPVFSRTFCSNPNPSASLSSSTRDGNFDETTSQSFPICRGCGVRMQASDPKQPGFFIEPSDKSPNYKPRIVRLPVAGELEISNSLKMGFLGEDNEVGGDEKPSPPSCAPVDAKPVVCARCHSLRYYGKVKDPTVENLLPDFDFDHTVGRRLASAMGTRTVVLMVVDAADFDGSFPRRVAKLLSATIDENHGAWKKNKPGNVPRVVLVVTKIDLLPSSVSPTLLEHWVRQRAREGGANKLARVHLVSALRDWGLKNLFDDVCGLVGERGNVWVIGAQNAGKSTLINSIGKHVGGKVLHLTEAPVPGTTLGILRVEGVLPGKAKLFDTPGLLHPHQISTRLTREEQKLVHVRKELKPRTYRIKVGHSIHIAGLMRLDIEKLSVDSIYITVWASLMLPLHMGKAEKARMMMKEHFGHRLQPPIGDERVDALGKWERKEFQVSGNSWDFTSVDIAAAGLGWFSVGIKGEAVLGVWTYDGVDVVLRNPLIRHRSQTFEVSGFTVSKLVSEADRVANKLPSKNQKNKKSSGPEAALPTV